MWWEPIASKIQTLIPVFQLFILYQNKEASPLVTILISLICFALIGRVENYYTQGSL